MANEQTVAEGEVIDVIATSAGAPGMEIVAQGATLVKLENSTQMSLAIQRPRNEAVILSAAKKELDLYPSMAKEAIYTKPVGRNDANQMQYAEGLSIRAAESLANRWTNSSYGCEITGEDEDTVNLAAVFLDYENNTRHVSVSRVSKKMKKRDGTVITLSPDRLELKVKAEQSKLLRERILRSLPAGLKKEYENKARFIIKAEPVANIRNALIERLADLKIPVEKVEKARGGVKIADMKKDQLTELIGLVNAIRDGETDAETAFGGGSKEAEQATEDKTKALKDKLAQAKGEGKKDGE
jgi:hypothetical protein